MSSEQDRAVARLKDKVAAMVDRIHQLAGEVERTAASEMSRAERQRHEWSSFARVAEAIVHEVTWGMANLNLSALVDIAAEADKVRLTATVAQPDPGNVLTQVALAAREWAKTAYENDRSRVTAGSEVLEPRDQQFVTSDIDLMLNQVARSMGLGDVVTLPVMTGKAED